MGEPSYLAVGALLVAIIALFLKLFDKGISLREYNEFKENMRLQLETLTRRAEDRLVIREFKDWRDQISRDIDRIEEDLRVIDQTKPSTGELQVAARAIEGRIISLEERIKEILNGSSKGG